MVDKIGWFPGGDPKYASVRVRSYYIIDFLKDCGIEVRVNDPSPDVLVFQKCLQGDKLEIALAAKKQGKRLIYDISDNVRSDNAKYLPIFRIAKEYILNADKMVVNGIGLKKILVDKFRKDAIIIEDSYPPEAPKLEKLHSGFAPKLIWQGYFKNMLMYICGKSLSGFDVKLWKYSHLEPSIDFRKLGYKLITIAEFTLNLNFLIYHPTYIHPQYPKVVKLLLKGDIGISPFRLWDIDCLGKSSNKIVSYMMIGLPVVASPIPAYCEVIENGKNGFLAKNKNEWLEAISRLEDPKLRTKISKEGYKTVAEKFSIETIGKKWLKLLSSIN